jgi:hypothetical protein
MHAHLNNARHVIKRLPSQLHVIAVVFNPLGGSYWRLTMSRDLMA